MTAKFPTWRLVLFFGVFFATGIVHWTRKYNDVQLGIPIAAAFVAAAAARMFATPRAAPVIKTVMLAFTAAIAARVVVDCIGDPTSHNLWPFELVIGAGASFAASAAGVFVGAMALRFLGEAGPSKPLDDGRGVEPDHRR